MVTALVKANRLGSTMIKIGRILGVGKQAEVYEFGDLALKLYKPVVPKESAFREAAHLAVVEGNGLPAPRVHAIRKYEGRWGIVMDRLDGANLGERIVSSAERDASIETLARMHRNIHTCSGKGLPSLKARLANNIRSAAILSDSLRELLLQQLDDLPDGNALCHCDFHPWNVIGHAVADWLDACAGEPAADVCRTYVLLRKVDTGLAADYVSAYVSRSDIHAEEVFAWLPQVAAARLAEDVPSEQSDLLLLAGVVDPR